MITFDEFGQVIPNIGDYKDPDEYFPCVIYLDKEDDYKTIEEWRVNEIIRCEPLNKDDEIIVFDDDWGKWMRIDWYLAQNLHKALQTLDRRREAERRKG